MKTIARFFLIPCFVVLVLGLILLNGLIQEARIAIDTHHRLVARRYFARVFHPLCKATELFIRFVQS